MTNFKTKTDLKNNYINFNNEICLNLILLFFEELDEKKKMIYLALIFNFNLVFERKVNINYSKELFKRAIDQTYESINKNVNDDKNLKSIIDNYINNLSNLKNEFSFIKKIKSNNKYEKISSNYSDEKSSKENSNGEKLYNTNEISKLNSKNLGKDNSHNTNINKTSNDLIFEKMKEELEEIWQKNFN